MIYPGNVEIINSLKIPSHKSECAIHYEIHSELSPGQAVAITIPNIFKSRIVDLVTLSHRKDVRGFNSLRKNKWDCSPAYSRVLIFDETVDRWQSWGMKYYNNLSFGDKLAEFRTIQEPEIESLHDWIYFSGIVYPSHVLILNVGQSKDATLICESLTIDVFPEDTITKQQLIFSPGTKFANVKKKSKEEFGGGISFNGQYPYAVPINRKKYDEITFPVSLKGKIYFLDDRNKLHIRVKNHYTFSRIEVAIGDTQDTGIINKDGHKGTLGGSKMKVVLQKKDGESITLGENLNIPPNGVLKASPMKKTEVNIGDEFVISAKRDPAFIMGIRIQ